MKRSFRFIRNLIFILGLLGILFSYAMFQGGFTSWFLFFSFLPIVIYQLGLLWYPLKGWTIKRKLSRHVVKAGDHIQVTIEIKRRIPFPLYYCVVEEVLPTSLNLVDNRKEKYAYMGEPQKITSNRTCKRLIFPWFRRRIHLAYDLKHIPRGEHFLQAIRVRTGDVFGFIHKEHVFPLAERLDAYPNERAIRMTDEINSFQQGSISTHVMKLKNTNVATGIREYMPGDRFSWIDWKQTAKKNDVMTKEFEQEKSMDTFIILDACYYEGIHFLAFEAAVEVTISLLETVQKQASQVGLMTIGEDTEYIPVRHDPTKRQWIRRHLTKIHPANKYPFSVKLKEELIRFPTSMVTIIITTNVDKLLHDTIQKMSIRHIKIHLIYIQAEQNIKQEQDALIQELTQQGIVVTILTEKQLIRDPIEVNSL